MERRWKESEEKGVIERTWREDEIQMERRRS